MITATFYTRIMNDASMCISPMYGYTKFISFTTADLAQDKLL